MTDLTKYIPQQSPVVTAIFAYHKRRGDAEPRRGYLGASIIGHPCERFLWYQFRQCCKEDIPGRVYRLFETGNLAEPRFVKELRGIGGEVHDVDENGQQFEVNEIDGHFSGHLDAAILGVPGAEKTWHVGEMKTHSAKSFKELQKKCVKESKPTHYAQMQAYMGLTGMTRALYLAVNKDTDDLYAERIHFDKVFFDGLMDKAERIITSNTPPERAFHRRDYFECSWCSANAICWGSAESALPIADVSCRQCCHATPTMDGKATWKCERQRRGLCGVDQDKACDDHLVLPGLLLGCEPVDHGLTTHGHAWIEFAKEDGELFRHGLLPGEYSTKELRQLPLSMLSSESFSKHVKDKFGARITAVSQDDILSRYPAEDCQTVWKGAACDLAKAWVASFGEDFATACVSAVVKDVDCEVAEVAGDDVLQDRIAIKWLKTGEGEIRQGKI